MMNEGGPHNTGTGAAQPKRRWRRRLLWTTGVVLAAALLLVALLPTLLSTGPGTRLMASMASNRIAGGIAIADAKLGWFGGQNLKGVSLYDAEGQSVVVIDEIDAAQVSLLGLAFGSLDLGVVRIDSQLVNLVEYEDGTTNLSRALGVEAAAEDKPAAAPPREQQDRRAALKVQLKLTGDRITYVPVRGERVEISDLLVTLDVATAERIEGLARATVAQGGEVGQIEAKGRIGDLFDANGIATPDRATLDVDASLTSVPVLLIDRLLNQRGRLVALAGSVASAQIRAAGPLMRPDATVTAQGPRFEAKLALRATPQAFTAQPDSMVRFTVAPQAWPVLVQDHATLAQSRLLEPFDVTILLQNLTLPREAEGFDLPAGAVATQITIGDVVLQTDNPRVGMLALRQTSATVNSEAIGKSINIAVQSLAEQDGHQGRLSLAAAVNDLLLADQTFNAAGYSARVDASINELPTAMIDEVAAMRGVLVELLGPTLQATLSGELRPAPGAGGVTGPVRLTAQSKNVQFQFAGTQHPDQFVLDESAQLAVRVDPEVLDRIKQAYPSVGESLATMRIAQQAQAQITLSHLIVPWAEAFDASGVEVALEASLSDLALTGDGRVDGLAVDQLTLRVPQTRLGDAIALSADGQWRSGAVQSTLQANATVTGAMTDMPQVAAQVQLGQLPVRVIDGLAGRGGQLVQVLGAAIDQVRLQVSSDATQRAVYAFALDIASPRLTVDVSGNYAPTGLQLANGSQARLELTPQAFAALQQPMGGDEPAGQMLALLEPLQLALVMEQARVGWRLDEEGGKRLDPANTSVSLRITSPGAAWRTEQFDQTFELRNVDVAVAARDLRDTLSVIADADVGIVEAPANAAQAPLRGRISSNTSVTHLVDAAGAFHPAQAMYSTQTNMRALPVALLDLLMQQQGLLAMVLGPQLDDVELTVRSVDGETMALGASVVSPRLNARFAGQFVTAPQSYIELRSEGPAQLVVTPQAFAALRARLQAPEKGAKTQAWGEMRLGQDTVFELELRQLLVGLRQGQPVQVDAGQDEPLPVYDAQRTGIVATLRTAAATLEVPRENGVDRFIVENLQLDINAPALVQPGQFSLRADTLFTRPQQEEPLRGRIASQTTVSDWVRGGRLDPMAGRYQTNTHVENLPVEPIDALLGMDQQLSGILGQMASLRAVGQFSLAGDRGEASDLVFELDSQNAKTRIAALIGEDVILREDIIATMVLTPQLADLLLKWGNPILIDATGSTEPIRMTVRREDFRLPLALFGTDRAGVLRDLSLDAEVQLGTVNLQDSWLLGAIMPELQKIGQLTSFGKDQQAKFTDMRVSVRDGFARSNDVWVQTPDMLVGVQGTVNLVKQYANLSVGIGSQTLRRFRFLRDAVPANEVFQIAVRGPISDLRKNVDLSPLFVPIAGLVAQGLGGERLLRDLPIDVSGLVREITLPKGADREWPNYPREESSPAEGQQPPTQQLETDQPAPRQPGLGGLLDLIPGSDEGATPSPPSPPAQESAPPAGEPIQQKPAAKAPAEKAPAAEPSSPPVEEEPATPPPAKKKKKPAAKTPSPAPTAPGEAPRSRER